MSEQQQPEVKKNQIATAAAGPSLTLLALAVLQAFNVPVTNEQIAVVAPLLTSVTHWLVHKFNKSGS